MKISNIRKYIFIALLFFQYFNTYGSIGKDTITHEGQLPSSEISLNQQDYSSLISKGFTLISGNMMELGVQYLVKGFQLKNEQDKDERISDVSNVEFLAVLNLLNSGKLKNEEKQLGYQFVKEVSKNTFSTGEENVTKYLSKNSKSVFVRRLKFLYLLNKPNSSSIETYTEKLLKLDSTIVSANVLMGRLLGIHGKYAESLPYLSRAIRLMPDYALAYYLRAVIFEELLQNENALKDYNRAIELYPNYFDAYNNRGNVKSKLTKQRDAIADYKKAAEIKPDADWPITNIALAYRKLNMNDSALYYLQEALDINPRNAMVYVNIGDIYLRQQDYGSAISNFTKSINIEPDNVTAYIWRGDAYFFDNKMEQAIEDYQKVIELDKKNSYAFIRLGDCYYRQKEYQKAIDNYNKSEEFYPKNLYLYISKGLCYNQIGKNEQAKESLLKAITIDSTSSPALGNLGWVYYCLGDYQKCISYSQRAIRYQDDAFYAMFNIAISTLRMGKYDESVELYKKYIDKSKKSNKEDFDGAIADLKDLIKQNILVKESTYIIENVFQRKE